MVRTVCWACKLFRNGENCFVGHVNFLGMEKTVLLGHINFLGIEKTVLLGAWVYSQYAEPWCEQDNLSFLIHLSVNITGRIY